MSNQATLDQPEPQTSPNLKRKPFQGLPGVDWKAIEIEFIRGATQDELCRKYSISRSAMEARCWRGNWKRKQKLANDGAAMLQGYPQGPLQNPAQTPARITAEVAMVAGDLAAEQAAWKAKMHKIATKIASGVARVDTDMLGDTAQTKKLAEAASALASVDTIGRRQLGLESEQASQPVAMGAWSVNVQVNGGDVSISTEHPGDQPSE